MEDKKLWYGLWCVGGREGGCGEVHIRAGEEYQSCPTCGAHHIVDASPHQFFVRHERGEPYGNILRVVPKNWKHNTRVRVEGDDSDSLTAVLRYDGKQDWVKDILAPIVDGFRKDK